MKLGLVTKLDKRNKTMSKKCDVDVMSENCNVIVIFWIFGQFGAVQRPDSGRKSAKVMFSVIATFYFAKKERRTKKSLTQLEHYCFE